MITDDQITQQLDASVRPFFKISSVPLPRATHANVADSLLRAIAIFSSQCNLRCPVNIVIGTNPIQIPLATGVFTYEMSPGVIGLALENIILIDVNAIHPLQQKIQVAVFLEEMVHAIMGVSNELTTSRIVAALYDGVKIIDGQYCVAT